MKLFVPLSHLFILLTSAPVSVVGDETTPEECPETWTCPRTSTPPTLDSDHTEDAWSTVPAFSTPLRTQSGKDYALGNAVMKCMHDDTQIYFALEIPGEYRFNVTDNKQCAAIGTLAKIGVDATFLNMGGCPDAANGCNEDGSVPETCSPYRVDVGAHWELKTTQQNVEYGMNTTTGSGNDLIANNDDEYAVHSFCRKDDDDEPNAANEWAGAWSHTDPTNGEMGTYHFELARLLTTASSETDVQLVSGETFSFGVAFWDPFETQEGGWTDAGHYLTGCGNKWVDLQLASAEGDPVPEVNGDGGDGDTAPDGGDGNEEDKDDEAVNGDGDEKPDDDKDEDVAAPNGSGDEKPPAKATSGGSSVIMIAATWFAFFLGSVFSM